MGLNLEFYLGNEKQIVDAVKGNNWHLLDADAGIVKETADLSFHLTHTDLDLLSKQMGIHSNQRPLNLMAYLQDVFHEEHGCGVARVDRRWIQYVARVDEGKLEQITLDWYQTMRIEHADEQIQATGEATKAVRRLWTLCRSASRIRNIRLSVLLIAYF